MDARESGFRNAVRRRYNELGRIWDDADDWHEIVRMHIAAAVAELNASCPAPFGLVVDVGSGGEPQPIRADAYLQFDFADARLRGQPLAAAADAHMLPLREASADCLVCVGSVMNYCSLIETAQELGRVCRPGGQLLFHVELSNSLEYLFRPQFRAEAALATTHYQGQAEETWVYSLSNVTRALSDAGFKPVRRTLFHIASALAYRMGVPPGTASRLAWLDRALSLLPGAGAVADSVIFRCVKSASP